MSTIQCRTQARDSQNYIIQYILTAISSCIRVFSTSLSPIESKNPFSTPMIACFKISLISSSFIPSGVKNQLKHVQYNIFILTFRYGTDNPICWIAKGALSPAAFQSRNQLSCAGQTRMRVDES